MTTSHGHYPSYGYFHGPYKIGANREVTISTRCLPLCGYVSDEESQTTKRSQTSRRSQGVNKSQCKKNLQCGRTLQHARGLREHLKLRHDVAVTRGPCKVKTDEKQVGQATIQRYLDKDKFDPTAFVYPPKDKFIEEWRSGVYRPQQEVGSDLTSSTYRLVFVPLDQLDGAINTYDSLFIPSIDHAGLGVSSHPWFTQKTIDYLSGTFGKGLAVAEGRLYIHQGAAMAEMVRECHDREVEYWSRDTLLRRMGGKEILDLQYNLARTVIFLYYTGSGTSRARFHDIFDAVANYSRTDHGNLRTFPRREEVIWEAFKLKDIEVLDRIAREAGEVNHRYRPVTCHGQGMCPLIDHTTTVVKRSWSCGSQDVQIMSYRPTTLHCSTSALPRRAKLTPKAEKTYFHQEFVESLLKHGEFRLFIVCERDDGALRRRRGKVVHTIMTRFGSNVSAKLCAINVSPGAAYWRGLGRSCHDLHEFAIYIFNQLRQQEDWEQHYESLEIGVRLDIGVSDEGSYFFVNEITRWYSADLFSWLTLGPPYTQLCETYVKAFEEYFGSR